MGLNDQLAEIGLTDVETRIYLALLKTGPASILAISREAGLNRPLLYRSLGLMVEKGVIRTTILKRRKQFVAIPPRQLIQFIKAKVTALKEILPELEALAIKGATKPRVLYFEGKEQLRELLRSQNKARSKEIHSYFPSKFMIQLLGKKELEAVIDERIRNKIHVKILRSSESEKEYEGWEMRQEALREVRHIPAGQQPIMGFVIFDNTVNFFSSADENFGVQIESPAYATLMKFFFNSVWSTSKPS